MPNAPDDEFDRGRIRAGLTVLTVVVAIALVLALLVDTPLVRLLMLGIVLFTAMRMYLLTRRVRRDARRKA
jgi:uncharacterized membrane protein